LIVFVIPILQLFIIITMSNEYERKDDLQLDEKARDQLEAGAEEDELRHVIANSVIQRWSAASIRLYRK
jgi:hypothetical protein